jgi:hypothetical protein
MFNKVRKGSSRCCFLIRFITENKVLGGLKKRFLTNIYYRKSFLTEYLAPLHHLPAGRQVGRGVWVECSWEG